MQKKITSGLSVFNWKFLYDKIFNLYSLVSTEKDQTLSISLHLVMLDETGGVPATEALVGQDGSSDDRLDRHGPGAAW